MTDDERPDPEALLTAIHLEEQKRIKGKLKIFLGMSAGVGKTYAMLKAAHNQMAEGREVVVGYVDTHGRQETEDILKDIPIIPTKWVEYRETVFEELDLEEIIRKHPQLVLVDELAHSNISGSRHPKRWQDVLDLLEAGIDVYTTVNVQHIESRKDLVESIAGISIRENVPDLILDIASEVELIDITPADLLKRLHEGKVYLGTQSRVAAQNFFKEDRLTALREVALRLTAEKVDHDLDTMLTAQAWKPNERLMVAINHNPESQFLIRAARRLAANLNAPWIAVHIDTGSALDTQDHIILMRNIDLARQLGAEVVTMRDPYIAAALKRLAAQKKVTQMILGRPRKTPWWGRFTSKKNALSKLIDECSDVDIHVIRHTPLGWRKQRKNFSLPILKDLSPYWFVSAFFLSLALLGEVLLPYLHYTSIGFFFLLGILFISPLTERGPILFAALLSSILWGLLFLPTTDVLTFNDLENFSFFLLYFLTALVTGTFISRIKQNEKMMQIREENTLALYEITQEIASGRSAESILEMVISKLGQALQGSCVLILPKSEGGLNWNCNESLMSDEKERSVALWAFEKGKSAGWSTDTLPSVKNQYIPLKAFQSTVGVLVYHPQKDIPLTLEETTLLHTVSRQLAAYLERSSTEEKARKQTYLQQASGVHHAIINSVATELMLYLDLMSQALPLLNESSSRSDALERIEETTRMMQSTLKSILSMSNIKEIILSPKKNEHPLGELVALSIKALEDVQFANRIQVNIPDSLPPASFDLPMMQLLLTHVLQILTCYAFKNFTIAITATAHEKHLDLSVTASIAGFSTQRGFQELPREDMKMGFAVAKAITDVHGGNIEIYCLPFGGIEFVILLPLS